MNMIKRLKAKFESLGERFKRIMASPVREEASREESEESASPPPRPPRRFATPVVRNSITEEHLGIKRVGAEPSQPRASTVQ